MGMKFFSFLFFDKLMEMKLILTISYMYINPSSICQTLVEWRLS